MATVFRWILSGVLSQLSVISDEFILGTFRIRASGNSLEVEAPDGTDEASARAIADRYVGALRRRAVVASVMTLEQFAALPASIQTISPARDDPERIRRASRLARNELLAGSDPYLRQAYDYVQTARERHQDGHPETLYDLYKAIEAIENAVGGEEAACERLGVRAAIKSVKRMANERTADERHAPRDPLQPPTAVNRALALDQAITVVRAYERNVHGAP